MALSPPVKLSEARLAVAIRCGQATGNYVPANLTPIIDEKLRSAHSLLWLECWWTRNLTRQSVALVVGQAEYDIPDNIGPEGLTNIAVMRASDSRLYDMQPGIRTGERNSALTNGRPLRYTFENQALMLFPAPDVNWSKLVIDGYITPGLFNADDMEASVDREALILKAEILVKGHFGISTNDVQETYQRYIEKLRSRQSDGEGFQLGGKQSWKTKPSRQNRILGTRYGSNVSGTDWNPPGWGG